MTELAPDTVGAEPLAVRGRSFYLDLDPAPAFACLHLPEPHVAAATGVVLCPAFGWDELASHRSVRAFAGELAQAGFPALRFDLPATGDSGGSPRDDRLVEAWTSAVSAAAASLQDTAGCTRVVALGIGLGGMLAYRALALGGPIDDLVLWAVQSRGSLFVRELQAFSRMFSEEAIVDPAGPGGDRSDPDDGSLNALGFVLVADTLAQLETLDLAALPIPAAPGRRVMLLGRDGAQVDRRLRAHFETAGVDLTVAAGTGYSAMMVDPQFSRYPRDVFAKTIAWLRDSDAVTAVAVPGAHSRPAVPVSNVIELPAGGSVIRETPFEFNYRGERLAGILTQPDASIGEQQLCAVLLNAGAVRRIGHNRQYVEIARRWAERGVPTLRFDVTGVGDSAGPEGLYGPRDAFQRRDLAHQVRAAFDELERRGLPPRFIVGGVCSGAYWGLHAALDDERVRGLLLVNLLAFVWTPELGAARDSRRARALLREHDVKTIIRIVASDRWRISRMLRTSRRRPGSRDDHDARFGDEVVGVLDRLRDGRVESLVLLSHDEPLYEDFVAFGLIDRLGEWPGLRLDRIPTTGHVFRSLWAQREMHRALDDALERTLGEGGHRAKVG
jgi:alpha-beta hydrolase superfamily lysophospholipase